MNNRYRVILGLRYFGGRIRTEEHFGWGERQGAGEIDAMIRRCSTRFEDTEAIQSINVVSCVEDVERCGRLIHQPVNQS